MDSLVAARLNVGCSHGTKMLTDALEELGVVYEDIAESCALASSVHFASRVEKELADLASNSA